MARRMLAICGSIKANSTNSMLLGMLEELAVGIAEFEQYDITKLPFFNPDMDSETIPEAVIDFRTRIQNADAVIICTPEYVFSLPGVLKNALEWTVSTSDFSRKPVALVVASSHGEKAFESLQLIMKTIEAKFDENTLLLIQGAKAKANTPETRDKLEKLFTSLLTFI